MISSAIWDESAQVNFSKVNQIAINFVVFEKFTSADLSQIVRDYLLIIYMQKFGLLFRFYVSPRHPSFFPPTNDNFDQDWSKF